MNKFDVDCYYTRIFKDNLTLCWFVVKDTKEIIYSRFYTLNINEISTDNLCRSFNICSFINKELEEKDLIGEKKEEKPLDVICYYIDRTEDQLQYCLVNAKNQDVVLVGCLKHPVNTAYNSLLVFESAFKFDYNIVQFINKKFELETSIKTDEFSQLNDKVKDLEKKNDELQISYNDLSTRFGRCAIERDYSQNKLKLADKKIENLIKENESLKEQLKNAIEKSNKYKSDFVLKNDELDYVSSLYKSLKKDVEKLEKKNDELTKREKSYCDAHEIILKECNELRKESDSFKDDINNYKYLVEDLKMEIASKTIFGRSASDIKDIFELNQSLKERIISLEIDNKSLIDSLSRNGIDKLILDVDMLKKENSFYIKSIENLEIELASRTVLGRNAADITALIEKNVELTNRNSRCANKIEILTRQKSTFEVENVILKEKIKDIGVLLQTLGINIESGDDLIVTIDRVIKDNK